MRLIGLLLYPSIMARRLTVLDHHIQSQVDFSTGSHLQGIENNILVVHGHEDTAFVTSLIFAIGRGDFGVAPLRLTVSAIDKMGNCLVEAVDDLLESAFPLLKSARVCRLSDVRGKFNSVFFLASTHSSVGLIQCLLLDKIAQSSGNFQVG